MRISLTSAGSALAWVALVTFAPMSTATTPLEACVGMSHGDQCVFADDTFKSGCVHESWVDSEVATCHPFPDGKFAGQLMCLDIGQPNAGRCSTSGCTCIMAVCMDMELNANGTGNEFEFCDMCDPNPCDPATEVCEQIGGSDGLESICRQVCDDDIDCDTGEICCPTRKVCEVPDSGTNPAACGDPHMTGFLGQKFDFTGEDGSWYCLIKDDNMQVNMRVSSPVSSLPEITYITGLAVLTADLDNSTHSIVIETKDPHNMESSCPAKVSPCLADGSLAVTIDASDALLTPGAVDFGNGVEVLAVNLPGACRSFGFEQYWEKKKLQSTRTGRRLSRSVDMGEWILGDPTATNMEECIEYVERAQTQAGGLFVHQSEHASFQIATPAATVRLSHGRLHQVAMRDPTDNFDLPDHLTWQMNFAVDHNKVSRDAVGILGETQVATLDSSGRPIMEGMGSIRGLQEDYRVEGPLGTEFVQGSRED